MDLLSLVRKEIVRVLWADFKSDFSLAQVIEEKLNERKETLLLDYLEIFDLPGHETGLSVLQNIFELVGFEKRGAGSDTLNKTHFIWMAESESEKRSLGDALPQIVLGEFVTRDLSFPLQSLVSKYANHEVQAPIARIRELVAKCQLGDEKSVTELVQIISSFVTGRAHREITKAEFETASHENSFLARKLLNTRKLERFFIGINNFKTLLTLNEVNDFLLSQCGADLETHKGSYTLGGVETGLVRSVTKEESIPKVIAGGVIITKGESLGFVSRTPLLKSVNRPQLWSDHFRGMTSASTASTESGNSTNLNLTENSTKSQISG